MTDQRVPASERAAEVAAKLAQVRELLATSALDAIILDRVANTAWITAGAATYVNEATDTGLSSVVVTPERAYVVTDAVEAPRLREEEGVEALGFEFATEPWYERGAFARRLRESQRVGRDGCGPGPDVGTALRRLRSRLLPTEAERYRAVCRDAAEAMGEATALVRPGIAEYAIAGKLAEASRARGGAAIVNLVAGDERVYRYRHPLPTAKAVERYAMLVLCFRRAGLVAALTRLVHLGPLPDELRAKMEAVARVDATMILGTRPGRTLGEMFARARATYAEVGYPEAIDEHHQGGSIAYEPREVLATPDAEEAIAPGQAFAWNPSIRGVKSEDTILLGADGPEVLMGMPGWPMIPVTIGGQTIARPAILER
jgi:antitoxin VapB